MAVQTKQFYLFELSKLLQQQKNIKVEVFLPMLTLKLDRAFL